MESGGLTPWYKCKYLSRRLRRMSIILDNDSIISARMHFVKGTPWTVYNQNHPKTMCSNKVKRREPEKVDIAEEHGSRFSGVTPAWPPLRKQTRRAEINTLP